MLNKFRDVLCTLLFNQYMGTRPFYLFKNIHGAVLISMDGELFNNDN